MSIEAPVIVFDGVCVLCNGWVRFLLRFDRGARYRFAAMQGDAGRALLARPGLDPDDPMSFLVIDDGRAFVDTDAIVHVLASLGAPWSFGARVLRLVPRRWRNAAYRLVARNRYRLFGRRDACAVPSPAARERFIA